MEKETENLQMQARKTLNSNYYRIWFRQQYNLTPNDPRYLDITDEAILEDYLINQEYQKQIIENRKDYNYYCMECNFIGNPIPGTNYCPTCRAEMMPPQADQTIAVDEDLIDTLEREDIHLSKSDKEKILR